MLDTVLTFMLCWHAMGIALYDELAPWQVAQWAAAMRHSPGWLNYSLKNEEDTDKAIAVVQNAQGVRLKSSHLNNDMVAAHWLKLMHYEEGYAWDDGFVFVRYRGKHHGLLMDEWNLFARWARDQGFPEILCASFLVNDKAHTWITECCGFLEVGIRSEGSQRRPDGKWMPVRVYASDGQDIAVARQRAEQVYTRGEWVDVPENAAM